MPEASDRAAWEASAFCVETQHSARSAETLAVQVMGSMQAWARNGVKYSASTFLADALIAAHASPSLRLT